MKNALLSVLLDPPSAAAAFRAASKREPRARTETFHLKRHRAFRVERKQQFKKIEVRSGVLWLTSTPADGDILLEQGEAFEFQDAWPYVIEAIEAAEVFLT